MFCGQCGQSLPDGAKFCSRCGASTIPTPNTARPQTGKLIIRRASSLAYAARSVSVFIDDQKVGVVSNGSSFPVMLTAGQHFVELKIGFRSIGSTQISVLENASVNLLFTISSTSGRAVFDSSGSSTVSMTQSKNSGCLWTLVIVIIVVVILWLVLPHLSIGLRFNIVPG